MTPQECKQCTKYRDGVLRTILCGRHRKALEQKYRIKHNFEAIKGTPEQLSQHKTALINHYIDDKMNDTNFRDGVYLPKGGSLAQESNNPSKSHTSLQSIYEKVEGEYKVYNPATHKEETRQAVEGEVIEIKYNMSALEGIQSGDRAPQISGQGTFWAEQKRLLEHQSLFKYPKGLTPPKRPTPGEVIAAVEICEICRERPIRRTKFGQYPRRRTCIECEKDRIKARDRAHSRKFAKAHPGYTTRRAQKERRMRKICTT